MGSIETQSLTNRIFVMYGEKCYFESVLHHRPVGRQIKMACDVPIQA